MGLLRSCSGALGLTLWRTVSGLGYGRWQKLGILAVGVLYVGIHFRSLFVETPIRGMIHLSGNHHVYTLILVP